MKKYKVHIFTLQIIANALKNKTKTTTTKQRPVPILGEHYFSLSKLLPGQDFPLVIKAAFLFRPCPSQLERARVTASPLLCVLLRLRSPEGHQQFLHTLISSPACPQSKDAHSVQLAKRALWVVLASKSERCQPELFHLWSRDSSLSCRLLCLLCTLQGDDGPSNWVIGDIFLACCTPAKTPSVSSSYSPDRLEYSMLLLGEEAQLF